MNNRFEVSIISTTTYFYFFSSPSSLSFTFSFSFSLSFYSNFFISLKTLFVAIISVILIQKNQLKKIDATTKEDGVSTSTEYEASKTSTDALNIDAGRLIYIRTCLTASFFHLSVTKHYALLFSFAKKSWSYAYVTLNMSIPFSNGPPLLFTNVRHFLASFLYFFNFISTIKNNSVISFR